MGEQLDSSHRKNASQRENQLKIDVTTNVLSAIPGLLNMFGNWLFIIVIYI